MSSSALAAEDGVAAVWAALHAVLKSEGPKTTAGQRYINNEEHTTYLDWPGPPSLCSTMSSAESLGMLGRRRSGV